MKPFIRHALLATAFVLSGPLLGSHAMAQSTQDMSLLTEQERKDFRERLQMTGTSAGRAKITAEMNRLVQERRMEQPPQKADTGEQ